MKKKCVSRGPAPTEVTLRMLCGQSAGMCEFRGCTERLFYDCVTASEFNSAYIAHIVASDPGGPRGDVDRSHLLSDKIGNLMLMCARHHRIIDDVVTGSSSYPESLLKEMKTEHEANVDQACKYMQLPITRVVNFASPIHGKTVSFSYEETVQAVLPSKYPHDKYGTIIKIESTKPETDTARWGDLNSELSYKFKEQISSAILRHDGIPFDLFALAPIPLIARLGELFSDKVDVTIHQKSREPNTWKWIESALSNEFLMKEEKIFPKDGALDGGVVLILSLTAEVSTERAIVGLNPMSVYRITAKHIGVNCMKSEQDLTAFWHLYQLTLDDILNKYGRKCLVRLIPAIPVSAAFEIGRRHMPGVHPEVLIYDHSDGCGYVETLTIGGKNVESKR